MKKFFTYMVVIAIFTQQSLIGHAQVLDELEDILNENGLTENNINETQQEPDLYITNAAYSSADQRVTVEVCENNNEINGPINTIVQGRFSESNWSQTVNITVSPYANGCSVVNFPIDKGTLGAISDNTLELSVDPFNNISELSEENNSYRLVAQFTQSAPEPIQVEEVQTPDFYAKNIFFDQLSEKIEATFCQANIDDPETYFPYVSLEVNNQLYGDKKVKLGNQSSGNECYTTRWHKDTVNIKKSDTYKLRARIDYTDDFVESNEKNNTIEQVMNISLLNETNDEQQYILGFDLLKKECKYDNEYLIVHCSKYADLKEKIDQSLRKKTDTLENSNKEDILSQTSRMENEIIELENSFPYSLEGEELNRKRFIFEYTKYSLIMLKHYITNENLDNFINDMLK